MSARPSRWALDHLVIGAASLDAGVAWCEATLGVTPGPGGRHPLMGTHNRLLRLAAPDSARAYLEIIAVDPEAPARTRTRWYDLDDAAVRASLIHGPRLIHWVARCDDLGAELAALRDAGVDRGDAIEASRGDLRWRIAVRADGARLAAGALPTLIAWGDTHPADTMAASPIAIESLAVGALDDAVLARLPAFATGRASPGFAATLATPRGPVTLECPA